MNAPLLFEYAVIRVVPKVEREEFINVGIVLYCATKKYLGVKYQLDAARLQALAPALDIAEVATYLHSFEQVCKGGKQGGPIGGSSTVAERFRWLTATRSTVLQTSKVHPGLCAECPEKLEQLFAAYVLV